MSNRFLNIHAQMLLLMNSLELENERSQKQLNV